MNKTAIKNFAVWARKKLIEDISYKAGLFGVSDKGIAEALPQSTNDLKFFDIGTKDYVEVSGKKIKQREALVAAIKNKERDTKDYKEAYEYIIEEVAYTWFNRLIAIRFMEVNDYLPSGICVLSSENKAKNEPDFVTNPFDADLNLTTDEQDKVIALKEQNKSDDLFRMLFIKQCNKLHEVLPDLFENTNDYSELLLTISFTDTDGIVYRLVHEIDEDDFNVEKEGQVEIIGWMYQYYNAEKKAEVFASLKKNVKITKENIPAATQLFTPDWIVRYMVENSLGRLWVEGHPNNELKASWKYYLEEAEQEPEVQAQLAEIRKKYATITPEQIKCIDPCCGSGHILVYLFDVLMQIYESYGYTTHEAVESIVKNNLYGLDIDARAAQLAYFAVMMKARQYDRRFFSRQIQPNVYAIQESNLIDHFTLDYFCNGDPKLKVAMDSIIAELYDAKEYASILNITPVNFSALYDRFDEIREDINISREAVLNELLPLVQVAEALAQKYDVVCTNPPYMAQSGMNRILVDYLKDNFNISKSDLFAIFIKVALRFARKNGIVSMVTMQTWMFLTSYSSIRKQLIFNNNIVNMAHLGAGAFEELNAFNVLTTMFTIRKTNELSDSYCGTYLRLNKIYVGTEKEQNFSNKNLRFYVKQRDFKNLPNYIIGYWISDKMKQILSSENTMEKLSPPRTGMMTTDNKRFLRLWYEVDKSKIHFNCNNIDESKECMMKWFPYIKGGNFRRWYGNREYIVNWQNEGQEIRENGMTSFRGKNFYFKRGITWSIFGFENFCARVSPVGSLFDIAGTSTFPLEKDFNLILSLLNSKIAYEILILLNPSVNFQNGDVKKLPIEIPDTELKCGIDSLTTENINSSKLDWDSFETSWDFEKHPLVRISEGLWDATAVGASMSYYYGNYPEISCPLELCYMLWQGECNERFKELKHNEEELNCIFIDIYGLQDDLTPEVEDKDVTVRKADLQRDIKSLISYAVGCMFGRYSLDIEGLAYAGGDWDSSKYESFIPDADNCIPITDEEYFEDDIVGRFVEFIKVVYGKDTLEENLDFIAKALDMKGNTSREVIRNYFLNGFIKDHIKTYQKRPIYWLFDSGKQNGFKALVYMHRWNADTTGNMRVEYLHRMQRVYDKEIERMQEIIDNSKDNKEVNAATKRKEKLTKQLKETKEYDAKIAHLALSRIDIDLDDGVKVNYEKVQTVDGKKMQVLAKI